jgi:hypothetical protein
MSVGDTRLARCPRRVGREVTFTGTDTSRIADGKLAEYQAGVAGRYLGYRSLAMWVCPPGAGQGPPQLSA